MCEWKLRRVHGQQSVRKRRDLYERELQRRELHERESVCWRRNLCERDLRELREQ